MGHWPMSGSSGSPVIPLRRSFAKPKVSSTLAGLFFPTLVVAICNFDARTLRDDKTDNNMAAIGSLVFCTDCGNLLPASKGTERNVLSCECCGAENKG